MSLAPYTGNIPNRLTGSETFSADVDYYHAYFTPFIAQFNADIAALNLNSVADTSTTSNTIGTGAKTFTVGIGKSFQAGQYLIVADTVAPTTNSMVVQVSSYNSGTGALVTDSKVFAGSGTKTAWIISLTAAPLYGTSGRTFLDIKQLQSIDYAFASGSLVLKLNPTNIDYRSTTLSNGTPTNVVNAAQVTTTISMGSTAGTISDVASTLLILAINNAGTTELAWTNIDNPQVFDEQGLITTVAEGGAGSADSSSVVYSTTARTAVPYRVVGIFKSTQTTAGTWAQTPSVVQPAGGVSLVSVASRQELDRVVPSFSAYLSATQSVTSGVFTKVQCSIEEFDTKNTYDAVTNYRFQPALAGIYVVAFSVGCGTSGNATRAIGAVFKNGTEYKRGNDGNFTGNASLQSTGSCLVYLNGTTDYIELFGFVVGTTTIISANSAITYFQATLNSAVVL